MIDADTDPFELARHITRTTRQQLERGDGHLYHLYQPLNFTADEASVCTDLANRVEGHQTPDQ